MAMCFDEIKIRNNMFNLAEWWNLHLLILGWMRSDMVKSREELRKGV